MRLIPAFLMALAVTLGFAALASAQAPAAQPPPPPPPAVKVGQPAPDFTLAYLAPLAEGKVETRQVKLSDFKGKQNVVLAFFPAAFSPGWTTEMSRYRDNNGKFNENNTMILGLSVDSTWANKAFREQLGVEFPILSDSKKDVARQYGVLNEQSGMARRSTFVIDEAGIVQHVDVDRDALDPAGALGACSLLKKKTQ